MSISHNRLPAIACAATAAATVPLACTSFSEDTSGSDAATAPDASDDSSGCDARFSCAEASAFCDDFDESILGARWSGKQVQQSGAVTIVPAGLSLPNALRAAIPAGTGSAGSLFKNFDGSPLACDFDVKLPAALPATGYFYLAGFSASGNGGTSAVTFGREGGWRIKVDTKASDGGLFAQSPEFADPPIGSWFHVRLAMTAAAASIAINGMPRATVVLPAASSPTLTKKFSSGVLDSSIVDGIEILFDNVACGPI